MFKKSAKYLLFILPILGLLSCSTQQTSKYFTVNFAVNYVEYGSVSTSTLSNVADGTQVTVDSNKISIGKFVVTATPTNDNYKFVKWVDYEETITKDTNITAVFEKSSAPTIFTVKWTSEGKEIKNDTNVSFGTSLESLKPSPDPSKPSDEAYDYPFKGWDANGDGLVDSLSSFSVVEDMTINAIFSKVDKTQNYVSKVTNGTVNGYAFKNNANNMVVYLKHSLISKNTTSEVNYLKLSIVGYDETNFSINTLDSSGKEIVGYEKEIIIYKKNTVDFYIPLKNTAIHDFSKYDLKLISKYSDQGFKIASIDYVNEKPSEETSPDDDIGFDVGDIF